MENIRERIVSCAGRVWFCAKELLKWLALAMITGVPCGIIGAAFDLAVEHVTELRTEHTAILFCCRSSALSSWHFIKRQSWRAFRPMI